MSDDISVCACLNVEYDPVIIDEAQRLMKERWRCTTCKKVFYPDRSIGQSLRIAQLEAALEAQLQQKHMSDLLFALLILALIVVCGVLAQSDNDHQQAHQRDRQQDVA